MDNQEKEKRHYYGETAMIADIEMQFVRYVEPGVEEWSFEANGKEQTYQRHING